MLYVWRPHAPVECMQDASAVARCGLFGAHERLDLPSFGAEFVIKNMEYKTMDEVALMSLFLLYVSMQCRR